MFLLFALLLCRLITKRVNPSFFLLQYFFYSGLSFQSNFLFFAWYYECLVMYRKLLNSQLTGFLAAVEMKWIIIIYIYIFTIVSVLFRTMRNISRQKWQAVWPTLQELLYHNQHRYTHIKHQIISVTYSKRAHGKHEKCSSLFRVKHFHRQRGEEVI